MNTSRPLLHLDARDDRVWKLTMQALRASHAGGHKPSLAFRCSHCVGKRPTLALAGHLPDYGPLFVSTWAMPMFSGVVLNGEPLTERKQRRLDEADPRVTVTYEGDPADEARHAVVALLALPAGMPSDYPDLLIRCSRHGDAVVDRHSVLASLRDHPAPSATGKPFGIDVDTGPRLDWETRRPDEDWLLDGSATRRTRVTTTRRFGSESMTIDEMRGYLDRFRGDHPPSSA